MGLFFWKNNGKIDGFAAALAEDLFSHVQPQVAKEHFTGTTQDRATISRFDRPDARVLQHELAGHLRQGATTEDV